MNHWRVAGVLCLIGVEALLHGYSYPFFSLALAQGDLANWLIGLNASFAGAGALVIGPLLPGFIARFGVRVMVAGLFAGALLAFAAILLADYLVVWFLARFVIGACIAALWTATEIWLGGVADNRHRGRIIEASATLYSTCQFFGALLLGTVGVTGSLPFLAAMVPLAIAVLVALSVRPPAGRADEENDFGTPRNLRLALAIAGGLVAAAFLAGIGKTAMQSLLPIYGLALGFDEATAARLVAIFVLGEAIFVAGLSLMADRYRHRLTLRLCVLTAALSMLAVPFSAASLPVLWLFLFVAGGAVAGIHAVGIALIGHDFRGHKLAVVTSGFTVAYSAGLVVGPAPVGYLIDLFGHEALPLAVAIALVGLSTYLFVGDDSEARAARETEPTVPNLRYLEDSRFEEDESADIAEPLAAEPDEKLTADADPFRPRLWPAAPESGLDMPLEDLEEQIRQRRAEITEIVARRHKSRETHKQAPPQPAKEPSRPSQAAPFTPRSRSNDGDA